MSITNPIGAGRFWKLISTIVWYDSYEHIYVRIRFVTPKASADARRIARAVSISGIQRVFDERLLGSYAKDLFGYSDEEIRKLRDADTI